MADSVAPIIRAALPTDLNFIRRTWLSGLRELPNGLPDAQWWPAHRAYIEACLLGEPAYTIIILATSDDPHEILGYAVAHEDVVEWIYVRPGLRRHGFAGILLRWLEFSEERKPLSRWRTKTSGAVKHRYQPRELRK